MLIINQLTFAFFLNRIYSMSAFDFVLFFFQAERIILLHCKQPLNLLKRFLICTVLLVSCLKPDAIKIIELADLAGLIIFNYYYCCSHTTCNLVMLEWGEGREPILYFRMVHHRSVCCQIHLWIMYFFQIYLLNNILIKSQKFNLTIRKGNADHK